MTPAQRLQAPRGRPRIAESGRSLSFVLNRGQDRADPELGASLGQPQDRVLYGRAPSSWSQSGIDILNRDRDRGLGENKRVEPKRRVSTRSVVSPRPDPSRALTSPTLPSTKQLSEANSENKEENGSPIQSPRRGRTRTVAPIVGRGWQTQESLPLSIAPLGVRQPERQILTPCASPPKRSIHTMVSPIAIGSRASVDEFRRKSASPRDALRETSVRGSASLEAAEDVFASRPIEVCAARDDQKEEDTSDDGCSHDLEVESIEAALTDAMETSLELPDIEDDVGPEVDRYDTIRSSGKRKNQEEPEMYPEKKGKVAALVARLEEPATARSRPTILGRNKTDGLGYRRPMSMIIQDSPCTIALSDNVQAEGELAMNRPPKWTRSQTMRADERLQKRPSIDNLIKGLKPIEDPIAAVADAQTWKARGRMPRRGTMPSMIRALEQRDPAEQKARPSLVKQVTEVVLSPRSTTPVPGANQEDVPSARLTESEALRTASISLKRIQDDDMERTMYAYQTRSRSHSPASHLEATYRASEENKTSATNGVSWDTPRRQNVMDRARHVGSEWLRSSRSRAGTLGSVWPNIPKASPSPTPPTSRPGILNRSASYAGNTPQPPRRRGSAASQGYRSDNAEEPTVMHTRWDGTKTPITERDHPTHYAALQEHRLVRQKSRQSLAGRRTPVSSYNALGSARDQDATQLVSVSSSVAPPVSIERWRQQLHQADGRALPHVSSNVQKSPREGPRPVYRHASTLPLPLDTNILSRSPTLSRSNTSQDSHMPLSACSGTSFDVKTAYDKAKAERGLVSFDQIPGLNDGE